MATKRLCFLILLLAAACSRQGASVPTVAPSPSVAIPRTLPTTTLPQPSTPAPAGITPADPPHGLAGDQSIGDAYIPVLGNTGYDVQAYALELDLDPARQEFSASIAITATVTLDNLGRLSLDSVGLDLREVSVDGSLADYKPSAADTQPSAAKLTIDLPRAYARGENLVIRIDYTGKFQAHDSRYAPGIRLGLFQPAEGQLLALSEPDGARAWFPCNDHPLDKAEFRIQARVPEGLAVVSNGDLLESHTSGGKSTYTWYEDQPIATYLVALAVGDYRRIEGNAFGEIEVRHYIFTDDIDAQKHLARTEEFLQFLTELLGPYPFGEFGFVEINSPDLAMETQTMILVDRNFWQKKDPTEILVHEAAHQWLGNSVSLESWGETWMKEGFATYIQYLWLVEQGKSLKKLLNYAEADVLEFESIENSALVNPDPAFMFGTNPYLKGAWVLHMLRLELGDEAFFSLLKDYAQQFSSGYSATADFQSFAEGRCRCSLEAFFDQWTESPAIPHLEVSWSRQAGQQVLVQVCQAQAGVEFDLSLDLRFEEDGSQAYDEILQVDERQERFTLDLPFTPSILIPDPDQTLLAAIQVAEVDRLTPCIKP